MRIALSVLLLVTTAQTVSLEIARKVVQDEFADLFQLNTARRNQNISPAFITGDFDGDGKMDLALLSSVRPEEVNRRFAVDPRFSPPRVIITKTPGKGMS